MPASRKEFGPLAARDCIPCHAGGPALKGEGLNLMLDQLGGGWQLVADRRLVKQFHFPDFRAALAFVDKVGALAEDIGHHPELTFGWGFACVVIWTHKIGGLTEPDFVFAAKVDAF